MLSPKIPISLTNQTTSTNGSHRRLYDRAFSSRGNLHPDLLSGSLGAVTTSFFEMISVSRVSDISVL